MKGRNILRFLNKLRTVGLVGCLVLLLLTGCGKRTLVVLLPEPNGKVGKIDVTNPKGDQALDQAYQSTVVTRPGMPPKDPVIMEKAAVDEQFGPAFKIMPEIPVVYSLFFELGTTRLKDYSKALLPDIVKEIAVKKSTDVSVIGHTDKAGTDEASRTLSFTRARQIADVLISMGVDPMILEVGYHGEGNPLIPTSEGIHEGKNRRVDVTIR